VPPLYGLAAVRALDADLFGGKLLAGDTAEVQKCIEAEIHYLNAKLTEARDGDEDGVVDPADINLIDRGFKVLHLLRHFAYRVTNTRLIKAPGFICEPLDGFDSARDYHLSCMFPSSDQAVVQAVMDVGASIPETHFHFHHRPITMDCGEELEKLTPCQQLIEYLLELSKERGFFRYRGFLYERITSPLGSQTPAFRSVCSVEDLVRGEAICRFTNGARWMQATTTPSVIRDATAMLTECFDRALPEIQKTTKTVFAFRNGIYVLADDRFYPYDGDERADILPNTAATKFIDMEMDWLTVTESLALGGYDFIPTPAMDSIFEAQDYDLDEMGWIYAFLARLLHPINTTDRWQMAVLIRGVARTGKSTIIEFVRNFFETVDVGVLANSFEKGFGFGAIVEKRIIIGPEIRPDFVKNVDQTQLQSVITGETSSYAVKYQGPMVCKPTAHMVLGSNGDLGLSDEAGQISRRFFVAMFSNKLQSINTDMNKSLERERALWLVKANKAYLEKVVEIGTGDPWRFLPPKFLASKQSMAQDHNSLLHFIRRSGYLAFDVDAMMPLVTFGWLYSRHCKNYGLHIMRMNRSTYESAFAELRELDEKPRITDMQEGEYRGRTVMGKWVVGVDAAEGVTIDE
jgi:hypothetical protein